MHLTEKEQMEKILLISGVKAQNCIQCGKCSATCPASAKMDILPHQFVNYVVNAKIAQLAKSETLWQCVSCFACSARCPKGVDPARLIEAVRLSVIRPQNGNRIDLNELLEKIDDKLPQQALVSLLRKYNK